MKYILLDLNNFDKSIIDKEIPISTNYSSYIGKCLISKLLKEKGLSVNDLTYKNGKPIVDGYYISVSHKDNYVVACINNKEIGVDIEKIKNFNKNILKYFFNNDEIKYIKNSNRKFFKLYTIKESILKIENKNLLQLKKINSLKCQEHYCVLHKYIKQNYILTICYKK